MASRFDVVIIGAGFAGMYALYRLRQRGLSVCVLEAADDVGGTWYWNRYPGARCDVPTIEYSYSFDKALEQEWDWSEVMSGQPEILAYANHVADRFDLRKDIRFDTRVTSATWDEAAAEWRLRTEADDEFVCRFCVMATGCLSVPIFPDLEGMDSFEGPSVHTGLWPDEGVDLDGKRVGVIGTGSSGVQAIPEIAKQAAELVVFQRTPVYTLPANNRPLDADVRNTVKAHYDEIRGLQRESQIGISGWSAKKVGGAGISGAQRVLNILDTPVEDRLKAIDRYGFSAISAYADVRTDPEANEIACELYREKVRDVIDDPDTAEKLCPRGYPIGCKRQVFDTGYYETFNQDHVTLVDLKAEPIRKVTPTGLETTERAYELDVLVYATGFDAMTGALNRIDIKGRDGRLLREKWADGPRAYLGIQSEGFPNLFMITGPGSPSVLSNMIVSIEQHVDWVNDCIAWLDANGYRMIEAEAAAEDAWVEHVNDVAKGTMLTAPTCNSWYLGANVPGKPRIFMPYVGGVGRYRQTCEMVAANGYEGFSLSA